MKPPSGAIYWILGSGLLMTAIALIGITLYWVKESTLEKLLMPLVALAAGTLLGGAFLHMIPAAMREISNYDRIFLWLILGFILFFILEQFLHWHHSHQTREQSKNPISYLILIGDGLHNFLGGIGIAGVFLIDIRLGIIAWLAAAAHEIPQEMGDFGVLVYSGWSRSKALLYNYLSGTTFLIGGLLAYGLSYKINVAFLIPFAAGNFIYIGASDLIPELKHSQSWKHRLVNLSCLLGGLGIMVLTKIYFD